MKFTSVGNGRGSGLAVVVATRNDPYSVTATANQVDGITLHACAKDSHRSTEAWMIWVTDSQLLAMILGAIPLFPTSGATTAWRSGPTCSAARCWSANGAASAPKAAAGSTRIPIQVRRSTPLPAVERGPFGTRPERVRAVSEGDVRKRCAETPSPAPQTVMQLHNADGTGQGRVRNIKDAGVHTFTEGRPCWRAAATKMQARYCATRCG
jgi:hypothetical protein